MRDRSEAGTTLLEALVVTAIVALIGGLAFPAIDRQLDAWRFASAERGLYADLGRARTLALQSAEPARIIATDDGYAIVGASRFMIARNMVAAVQPPNGPTKAQ